MEQPRHQCQQRLPRESGILNSWGWMSSSPPSWERNSHLWKPSRTPSKTSQRNKIESIEQWVCCFNTYTAVMHPDKVGDLLAYSSLIVNASSSYEGTPWLDYDNHFQRSKATSGSGSGPLAQIDSSIWTLHFNGATAKKVCTDCFEPGQEGRPRNPAEREGETQSSAIY